MHTKKYGLCLLSCLAFRFISLRILDPARNATTGVAILVGRLRRGERGFFSDEAKSRLAVLR